MGHAVHDKLGASCRGLVPAQHIAGRGSQSRRPQEGQKVTVRVLERDASARRLTLTMKRLLLEGKLAPFTSWEARALFTVYFY